MESLKKFRVNLNTPTFQPAHVLPRLVIFFLGVICNGPIVVSSNKSGVDLDCLVVITDGANGSWVFANDGTQFQQPAYLLPNVVDTTGCGDSYHGAFLFGLIKGMTLRECARLASAVAALNAQQLGGRSGLPNLAQVQAFLS